MPDENPLLTGKLHQPRFEAASLWRDVVQVGFYYGLSAFSDVQAFGRLGLTLETSRYTEK